MRFENTPNRTRMLGSYLLARVSRKYWAFAVPAVVVVLGVIVFPWLFTVFMSVHDWKIGGGMDFVGLDNFRTLVSDERFRESLYITIYFTALAVVIPIVLGTMAALVFHRYNG